MSILVALMKFVISEEMYLQIKKNNEYVLLKGLEQAERLIDRSGDLERELCEPGDVFSIEVTPK